MEWVSSKKNDIIADHFSFFLSQFPEEDSQNFDIFHNADNTSLNDKIKEVISQNYQNIEEKDNLLEINNGLNKATINMKTYEITSENENLKLRLTKLIQSIKNVYGWKI